MLRAALVGLVALTPLAAHPKPVTVVGELVPTTPGAFTYNGTWTMKGAVADRGTLTAAPTLISNSGIVAVDRLTGKRGKLVLKLHGAPDDLTHWRWSVVSGTGVYARLRGGGTAVVDQSDPDHVHEVLRGTLR